MKYYQSENSECGLICLAYASSKMGAHLDVAELRRKFASSTRGLSLRQLTEIATALDLMARGVRCEVHELAALKLPAILHWDLKHFVVLEKVTARSIVIHDPAKGEVNYPLDAVGKHFSGIALEISPSPSFKPRRTQSPLSIWAWIRFTPDLKGGLAKIAVLSVILQAYVLVSPFFMQLSVDQGALKGDNDLLTTLAIGFGLFGIFNVVADLLRNFVMQQVSAMLSWDMSLRLFRHLMRLPLDWFQKRKLADTISRLDSINPIRDLVAGSLVTAMIDGVLALSTLCMLFVFNWALALMVLAATATSVLVRVVCLPSSLRLSGESLTAQIAETGKRIELIKAIQTIKAMGAETSQEIQWANKYSSVVRKNLKSSKFKFFVQSQQKIIDAVLYVTLILISCRNVIDHTMSVGILYGFLSYKNQFSTAVSNVADQIIQWKLSDIYSFRLADIVLSPIETGLDAVENDHSEMLGDIEIEGLAFRYAGYDPFVFKGLNLRIPAGSFVAIVGASGAGKTSLLKVMCGLYPATTGEIRIDGRSLASWGPRALRNAFGIVMQDDELLSGTVLDNVTFFAPEVDVERVWDCLEQAAIKSEILALPMKLDTFVGDMGSSLSGGQKQRLLIARALYKQPKVLFFDEATSNLDQKNEAAITHRLDELNLTRVVIAHRLETIKSADIVFDLKAGRVVHLKQPLAAAQ